MRIEAYNQIQQIYNNTKVAKANKTAAATRVSDAVQISSFGKDLQAAKAALKETPDIRENITIPLKAKIQNGSYDVPTSSFADKLMDKWNEAKGLA